MSPIRGRGRRKGRSAAGGRPGRRLAAHQITAADDVVRAALAGVTEPRSPEARLRRAGVLLELAPEIREERRKAIAELRENGWTWQEIGQIIGLSKDRAWQIGHGL
jgi:hypothetical protein